MRAVRAHPLAVWHAADGRRIKVRDMESDHLVNALAFARRTLESGDRLFGQSPNETARRLTAKICALRAELRFRGVLEGPGPSGNASIPTTNELEASFDLLRTGTSPEVFETERLIDLYAYVEQVLIWIAKPRAERPPHLYTKGPRDVPPIARVGVAINEELARRAGCATIRACSTNSSPAAHSSQRSSTKHRAS